MKIIKRLIRCMAASLLCAFPLIVNAQLAIDQSTVMTPIGGQGSWLKFVTGGDPTSIIEQWGLNLIGDNLHPVKVVNTSLLVGYTSVNTDFGIGNAFVAGRLGLGTNTVNAKLHVKGTAILAGNEGNIDPAILGMNLSFLENTGQMMVGWNRTAGAGETDFISNRGGGGTGGFAFYNHDNNGDEKQLMWILGNGQVLINSQGANQGNHMLAVGGSIIAESITVKLKANWPDFVFNSHYKRPTLKQLHQIVKRDQHLPGVPSAAEVSANGLDLGELNRTLLKKVEELTMYLIEKDQQLDKQSKLIKAQGRRLANIEKNIRSKHY